MTDKRDMGKAESALPGIDNLTEIVPEHGNQWVFEIRDGIKVICCLGNPGEQYDGTRHNAGFEVGKALLSSGVWRKSAWQPGNGRLIEVRFSNGRCVYVLMPLTYMNASGECAGVVMKQFGYSPAELLVISDCLDLPVGRLRFRTHGSSGGQRGLRSIFESLGTEDIPRLRVGIGRPQGSEESIVDYVLSRCPSVDRPAFESSVQKACAVVQTVLERGLEAGMLECNSWSADNNNA